MSGVGVVPGVGVGVSPGVGVGVGVVPGLGVGVGSGYAVGVGEESSGLRMASKAPLSARNSYVLPLSVER
jgi:hypothetical protein